MSPEYKQLQDDWKFVGGTILCLLNAFIIGIFHFGVLYLFGIPLILLTVGVVLLVLSKVQVKARALVGLVTLALIPLTFAASIYLSSAKPETFLIPDQYRGQIVVFFDEPCGSEEVEENGRRVYVIGADGILITKAPIKSGYIDRKFFYIKDNGERTAMPAFQRQNFETEKKEWNMYKHPVPVESFTLDTVGAFWGYGTETYGLSRNSFAYYVWSYNDFVNAPKVKRIEIAEFTKKAGQRLNSCREFGSQ